MMLCKIILLSLGVAIVSCALDCASLNNGAYYIGCKVFATCHNHVYEEHECKPGFVFNNASKSCALESQVPPPCGLKQDCSSKLDGSYADLSLNCTSYFTCNHHVYFGHNFCTPGTVFENTMGTCVWLRDAYAPCGNKTH